MVPHSMDRAYTLISQMFAYFSESRHFFFCLSQLLKVGLPNEISDAFLTSINGI
jgi:hypothetical protein